MRSGSTSIPKNVAVVTVPIACRFARSAVHHQFRGTLTYLFVEVVHEHAHGRFLLPALAGECRATRCTDGVSLIDLSVYEHEVMVVLIGSRKQSTGCVGTSLRPVR